MTAPPPDPLLQELYQSDRPAVELLPGVPLAPIVNACWLPKPAKDMLAESWIPVPPEEADASGDASTAPQPPSFDVTNPEYTELVRRLAKTDAFQKFNELKIQQKILENQSVGLKGADAEAKAVELETVKAALAEAEAKVAEVKESFAADPLSLVPWMQALMDLADAGLTTFDVSGSFWPYCNLRELFPDSYAAGFFDGVEKVLGTFKRRYEQERGPNRIQLLLKLAPNIFQDGWSEAAAEAVTALVERARANVYGPDSAEPLDLLQVVWWDVQAVSPLPVLKVLQKLASDTLEVAEDSGEVSISEAKKVRGIGLVDFPADALKEALQAGVPVTCVQVEYSVLSRASHPMLELCKQYGVKVLARGGTLGGLLSAKYVGAPPPDSIAGDDHLDSVPAALDTVNNLGGWPRLQAALGVLKAVADKHGVQVEAVALRWQIDQGVFPLVTTRWAPHCWRQFGYEGWVAERRGAPGLDGGPLFSVASFLDADDADVLARLA